MRFHLPALPHDRTPFQYSGTAYQLKVDNFSQMMMSLGHEVFHYGAEEGPTCTEHIRVISADEQREYFSGESGFQWDANQPYWKRMNRRIAECVEERQERGDFLCLIGGVCQKPIVDAIGEAQTMAVEIGIGYYGTFARYRVFESYSHQALCAGQQSSDPDCSLYDAVIPGFFNVENFPFQARAASPGYLAFVGRIIQRKGVDIAVETARATGMPLIIVGRGGRIEDGHLITEDHWPIKIDESVTYLDHVPTEERNRIMGGARAALMPTRYYECFGNVAVEAHLMGTPVISTDHGAFAETIRHGVNGYRCHTLAQFAEGALRAGDLDRRAIRDMAVAAYSTERVKYMYEEYFTSLHALWTDGWPSLKVGCNLDWLTVK